MTRREVDRAEGARSLIGTKLDFPKTPPGLVTRLHLVDRLDRGRDERVTLLSAPAGYGKTTLVAQWLDREAMPPVAWLSLDRMDSDLERFVRYVVAALQRVEVGCLAQTAKLLSARNVPPPQYLAESMIFELAKPAQRVVLVLDDFGLIRAPAVHEFMDSLVTRLPSTLHLVVISRIDPPLPLSLWRSRHWLRELRAADLRFSREETGAFFDAAEALRLSDAGIDTIHRKTEGWIAGLRLALLSISGSADPEAMIDAFSASDRVITDYLMEEVLARQPSEIKEFLAITSVFERFSPQLCDKLLALSDRAAFPRSQEFIDRLLKQNLFLVPLGPSDGWYRYHHLFQQLLLERFDELTTETTQAEILKHAGDWFCDRGWSEDGLKCFLAADDLDAATDVIAAHLDKVIVDDWSRRSLARWLAMFPPAAECTRLPLLIAASYMRTFRTDYEGVDRLLDEIDVCHDAKDKREQRWRETFHKDLGFLRAFTAFWHGDIERAYEYGRHVLGQTSTPQSFLAMATIMYYGASLALTGRWAEYLRFIEGGTTGPGFSDSPQQLPYRVVEAVVHLYRGDLAQCRAVATRLTASTQFAIPPYFAAIGYFLLGVVTYERNRLDEAERHFLAVESRRFEAAGFAYHGAAVGLAQIAMVRGDIGAAGRHAAAARAFALESQSAMLVRASDAFENHLAVAAGTPPDAAAAPPPDPDFMQLSITLPSHSWAWLLIHSPSSGTRRTALGLIDSALHLAEAHGIERRVVQLVALRALALDARDRRVEAIPALEAALQRGAAQGFVRSFIDCGEGIRTLLHAAAERNPDEAYAAMLLDAAEASVPTPQSRSERPAPAASPPAGARAGTASGPPDATTPGAAPPNDLLTNRELDVLEQLHLRLSNKEIAARLGISAATVKMHTNSIYRKLGVHGRRQATAVATELGILTR